MHTLMEELGGENGIRAAYERSPDTVRPAILEEIRFYEHFVDRDHVSREYVMMLRRVLGEQDAGLHAEHARKMKEALAKIKPPAEP